MQPTPREPDWIRVALGALALAFYAVGIGAGSQADSDGVIYAQMAREQLARTDFVDTSWLGVVQFEKPPLLIWSLAASGALFGWGEAALRVPLTLFAVAGLLGFYALALALELPRRAALSACGLLATSTLYLWLTRSVMTDVPMLAAALWSAAWLLTGRPGLAGAAAGACLLAKGPAGVPLLAAGIVYAAWSRRASLRALPRYALGLVLVAAPWYVAISLRHGTEFWAAHLGYHVWMRVNASVVPGLTPLERLTLLGHEGLFGLLALLGLGAMLRDRLARPADRFVALWLLCSVPPLIISRTVLAQYFLPLTAAMALLSVRAVPIRHFDHPRALLVAAACVFATFFASGTRLMTWLDPDFGPDEKAMGQLLATHARPTDLIAAYNVTSPALVFYSGGLAIDTYADDPRLLEILHAVLLFQRQTGHPGQIHALTEPTFPTPRGGHRFIVTGRNQDLERALSLLAAATPRAQLHHLRIGTRVLISDTPIKPPRQ